MYAHSKPHATYFMFGRIPLIFINFLLCSSHMYVSEINVTFCFL